MPKLNSKNNKIIMKRAFTLVETLVAIAILSLSVMSASVAVRNGLATSYYARDQITAYYLIQEAVEYIRNIRDSNALANLHSLSIGGGPVNWLTGISSLVTDPCYFGNICTIDVTQNTITACPSSNLSSSCPYLNQNVNNGLFGYVSGNGWSPTKFKRFLQISSVDGNEVILTATVSWSNSISGNASISVREWLFNTR